MQSRHKEGALYDKRQGMKQDLLHRRRSGTVHALTEWIKYYTKKVESGEYCPIRGKKIIARFEKALAKKKQDDA